MISIYFDIKD